MHQFRDGEGQSWNVVINIGLLDHIEQETEVDLMLIDRQFVRAREKEDPESLTFVDKDGNPMLLINRLQNDERLLYELMYAVIQPQLDGADINPVEFARRCTDTYEEMKTAFFEELANFYRSLGRGDLAEALIGARKVFKQLYEKLQTNFNGFDPDMLMEQVNQALDGMLPSTTPKQST